MKPYLSIVRYARNDDHGGNFLKRMQTSLNCLFHQLDKYCLESELVLIDWNPPPNKPPLREAIQWPETHRYCTVRIIEVDPSIHQRYPHHDKIPMHRAVPWNVGIRRSRGEFILIGSVDLLYPDELIVFLSLKNLKEGCLYRTTRMDVDQNVFQLDSVETQLKYCEQNVLHIHPQTFCKKKSLREAIDLPDLHDNASGDFLLMSKNCWHRLRGYRETNIIAAHNDSLLCFTAYAAGIREIFLGDPIRIYHIDHEEKFIQIIKNHTPLMKRIALAPFRWLLQKVNLKTEFLYHLFFNNHHITKMNGVRTLSHFELVALCKELISGKRSYIFNDERWGLGEEPLSEVVISHAEWDNHR